MCQVLFTITILNESAIEEYDHFIIATEEAATEVLPQIKGATRQKDATIQDSQNKFRRRNARAKLYKNYIRSRKK